MATVAHLGKYACLGRRYDRRKHLLGRRDTCNLGLFDTERTSNVGKVAYEDGFLLEVGQRYYGHVGDAEQLATARQLYHRHVAQCALRGEEASLLVEDAAHILVGRHEALHQHVGTGAGDKGHGLVDTCHVVGFVDYGVIAGVYALGLTGGGNAGPVAKKCCLYQAFATGMFDSPEGVGVVGTCHCQSAPSSRTCALYDLC